MIFLTGDTHAEVRRLSVAGFPTGKELTKNDYVIILGDFGLIWDRVPSDNEKHWCKWLSEKPWTTLFLDGNHENFNRIDLLEEIDMFGGKVGKLNNSIFHLKRGEVYTIDGHKFFTFGGGLSIDKSRRIPDISWWDRELPNYKEYKNGLDNLSKHNFKVDYILSHDISSSIYKKLDTKFGIIKTTEHDLPKYLEEIESQVDFKLWYFGHFHFNSSLDDKHICLYEDIIKLGKKPIERTYFRSPGFH